MDACKSIRKKLLNVALSVVLICGLLPAQAFAEVSETSALGETQTEIIIEDQTQQGDSDSVLSALEEDSPIRTIEIGAADRSANDVPYANSYKNSGIQAIYTASEIGCSGTISSIAFNVTAAAQLTASSLQIYMGTTSATSFSSADAYTASDLTLVYSSGNVLGIEAGWEELELDTPFEYDGTSNLVVAVYHQATSYKAGLKYASSNVEGGSILRTSDADATAGTLAGEGAYTVKSVRPDIAFIINTCTHTNLTLTEEAIPNCISGGYEIYKCNDCGLTLTRNVRPATGVHTYVAGICKYCNDVHNYWAVLYGGNTLVFQNSEDAISTYGSVSQSWEMSPTAAYSSASTTPWSASATSITRVVFAEGSTPRSMAYWFSGMTSLASVDLSGIDASGLTSAESMFEGCTSLAELDLTALSGPADRPVAMASMLKGCSALEAVELPTASASSAASMLEGCSSLKALDLTPLDTAAVGSMRDMFRGCSALAELDLTGLDTGNVRDMSGMFCGCSALTELDLSSFSSASVTCVGASASSSGYPGSSNTTRGMFENCSSLVTIYASPDFTFPNVSYEDIVGYPNGNTARVTFYNDYYLFSGCTSLVGGSGTAYSSSYVRSGRARVDSTDAPGYFTQSCAPGAHTVVVSVPAVAPTCTEVGHTAVSACSICGRVFESAEEIPATGHTYGAPVITFAADGKTATATWTCVNDASHIETADCTVTGIVLTQPTCTSLGVTMYTAVAAADAGKGLASGSDTKTLADLKALGHNWSDWQTVTAATCTTAGSEIRVCANDASHTETHVIEALGHDWQLVTTILAPTCTTSGYEQYVCKRDPSHVDVREAPATGHSYGAPTIVFAADGKTATALWMCANDPSHIETAACTVTSTVSLEPTCAAMGKTTYTATIAADEAKGLPGGSLDKTLEDIPAAGHDFGTPAITFAADGSSATAVWICSRDASHTETATCTITTEVTKAATCEGLGETTFTATAAADAAKGLPGGTATLTLANIPPVGHTYGEPEITFTEDHQTAIAIWRCANDAAHVETAACEVTSEDVSDATCTTGKLVKFTATVSADEEKGLAGATASETVAVSEPIGHDYEEGICKNCGDLLGDVNGSGTVNIVDAQIAYDIANGMYAEAENYAWMYAHADVTGPAGVRDGIVEAIDAWRIQYIVLRGWALP